MHKQLTINVRELQEDNKTMPGRENFVKNNVKLNRRSFLKLIGTFGTGLYLDEVNSDSIKAIEQNS